MGGRGTWQQQQQQEQQKQQHEKRGRLAWWLTLAGGPRQGQMCGMRVCDWPESQCSSTFGCRGLRKRCPKQTSGPVANAGACPCKQINRLMEASALSAMTLVAILVPAAVQFPQLQGPFCESHSLVGWAISTC